MINGIVCASAVDWGIGKQNGLLFDLPADMKFFRETTKGHVCVFGYSTYLSLSKRPLPHRINVVLWDQATSMDCLEGAITFNSFKALLNFVQILAKELDIFICGGQSIYRLFLPYYDNIFVTKVEAEDPEATAFFPNIDKDSRFKVGTEVASIEDNGYKLKFLVYNKVGDAN